jgi:deoxyribodipyrimidine photo-lyase
MMESLLDLDSDLRKNGNHLVLLEGNPVEAILQAAEQWNCEAVFSQTCHTEEETQSTEAIAAAIPHHTVEGATLVHPDDLPFSVADLPEIFSRFRNKVEKRGLDIRDELFVPILPPPPSKTSESALSLELPIRLTGLPDDTMLFDGGAIPGWKRLNHYFWGIKGLSEYKQTRNGMLGWDYSSKFSPWLAWGCMSPRSIYHAIRRYEADEGANDSTYWLIFELLWRDYFRFLALQHGKRIWHSTGLKEAPRNPVSHHPLQWKAWCTGNTRSAFVNSNMHELRLTGFMSNRGRQNVASYAVHDLGLDWRACAAWFEHWLIDFDPCSNTGNWLYVAGIGNDPRPQRKFDVDWQAERYDPQGAFQSYWNRLGEIFPLDPDQVP